jgi:nicotinamide-nucleotide amidase
MTIEETAARLLDLCRERGIMLATAESCTGGMIAAALTAVAGSSAVVDRGFVTYSNEAKTELLGVKPDLIAAVGAVSQQVAEAMAAGALQRSRASLALAVTGIAGPGGGSAEKPVGLVWFGVALRGAAPTAHRRRFPDDGRAAIREAATLEALTLALDLMKEG